MKEGDFIKKIIKIISLLINIKNSVEDSFFLKKINTKMFDFSIDSLEFVISKEGNNVAQCKILIERCLSDISGFSDLLDELRHLKLISNPLLLLKTEYYISSFKLEILKSRKEINISAAGKPNAVNVANSVGLNEVRSKVITRNKDRSGKKLNESKKKILEYIKSYPNTRTKDIIYEFNVFSGRTVKRNLTDLLKTGLIRKRIDNKAVYYYASE